MSADIWRKKIREALERVDPSMASPEAVELLLGTAARESRLGKVGNTIQRHGVGPFQIIRSTEKDIWKNYLRYKPDLREQIIKTTGETGPNPQALIDNFDYAATMARIVYKRIPQPLPAADDTRGQAKYWKQHYNTKLGKGTVSGYMKTAPDHKPSSDTSEYQSDTYAPSGMYQVKRGDTLGDIAKRTMGSAKAYRELFAANRDVLDSPHKIYPGQKLRIPGKSDLPDKLKQPAESYGVPIETVHNDFPYEPAESYGVDVETVNNPDYRAEEEYPDRPEDVVETKHIPNIEETWQLELSDPEYFQKAQQAAEQLEPTLSEMAMTVGGMATMEGILGLAMKMFGKAPLAAATRSAFSGGKTGMFGQRVAKPPSARLPTNKVASPPAGGRPGVNRAMPRPVRTPEPTLQPVQRPAPSPITSRPPQPQDGRNLLAETMRKLEARGGQPMSRSERARMVELPGQQTLGRPVTPQPEAGNPELLRLMFEQAVGRGGKPLSAPGKMIDVGGTKNMSLEQILKLLQ